MERFDGQFNSQESKKMEIKEVPQSEIAEDFARSGGRGGQNINKRSTKVELRWNVERSADFSREEKERIKQTLGNRINSDGELIIVSQEERTQGQNRIRAMERLNKLVNSALIPEKERVPTKPTRSSKERRLKSKKQIGEKKRLRKRINY